MMKNARNNNMLILYSLFLLALCIRIISLVRDPLLMRDSALYIDIIDNDISTNMIEKSRLNELPPLPLILISSCTAFWGLKTEIIGRAISIFLNSLIPVIGFQISRALSLKIKVSLPVGLLLAVNPPLVEYSKQILRENYYLPLAGLILFSIITGIKHSSNIAWMECGALCMIAAFCRIEAVEFLIIATFAILFFTNRKKKFQKIVSLYWAATIALLIILVSFDKANISFLNNYIAMTIERN